MTDVTWFKDQFLRIPKRKRKKSIIDKIDAITIGERMSNGKENMFLKFQSISTCHLIVFIGSKIKHKNLCVDIDNLAMINLYEISLRMTNFKVIDEDVSHA